MILRYAGIPLLLEDPGFEFQAWLEQALSLSGLSLFGAQDPSASEGRYRPRGPFLDRSSGQSTPHVGLPQLNYSTHRPPQWRINTLWWPSGACRHSIGLFLVDTASLKEIQKSTDRYGYANLEIGEDDEKNPLTFSRMHLLPPHKIDGQVDNDLAGLWLICLVDRRYYWPQRSTGDLTASGKTWSQLLESLTSVLGVSASGFSAAAAYGYPDATEFTRKYENAALLIDAVASSTGQRVSLTPAGVLKFHSPTTGSAAYGVNLAETDGLQVAGGAKKTCPPIPASVAVVYPKQIDGELAADGAVWADSLGSYEVDQQGDCDPTTITGTTKLFHSTAKAVFANASATVPTNFTDLRALTTEIAQAYLNWLTRGGDIKFLGMVDWDFTGFEDFVLWSIGSQHRAADSILMRAAGAAENSSRGIWQQFIQDYDFATRVVTQPANFGFDSQLSSFTAYDPDACFLFTPCTSGTAFVGRGTSLFLFLGKIVVLDDDYCYTVSQTNNCTNAVDMTLADIYGSYDSCSYCGECARLISCADGAYRYVRSDQVNIFPDVVEGKIMRIDGECYLIDDVHYTCPGDPEDLGAVYQGPWLESCDSCGCHLFIDCNSSAERYVNEATYDSNPYDLDSLPIGAIVREGTSSCWEYQGVISNDSRCSGASALVIQEVYNNCYCCTAYELTELSDPGCSLGGQPTITTNSDLCEYSIGETLKRAEDGLCYELTDTVAFSGGDVAFTVEERYDYCEQCQNPLYKLISDCPTCCSASAGSTKITDEDLSAELGQYIKVTESISGEDKKTCYFVELADYDDSVTLSAPLTYEGPFTDCTTCQKECRWIVEDVEITGGKLVQHKIKVEFDNVCDEMSEDIADVGPCEE